MKNGSREKNDVESAKIGKTHDRFVASFLENPVYAADFLSSNLPPELTRQIDWERLTVEPTTFADERNRLHFADLAFSAPYREETKIRAKFFVLLEHKSNVERTLGLQLLRYVVLEAAALAERSDLEFDGRFPCPIAFVLHNGTAPLKRKLKPSDALFAPSGFERFVPDFEYFVLDLAATETENLRGGSFVRTFLELLKRATNGTLTQAAIGILRLYETISEADALAKKTIKSFWNYLADVARNAGRPLRVADIQNAVDKLNDERLGLTMKTFLDEIEEKGIEKGREEGITTAIVIALRERFGASVSAALIDKLESINDYPTLEEIFRAAFNATKLDDIERFIAEVSAR